MYGTGRARGGKLTEYVLALPDWGPAGPPRGAEAAHGATCRQPAAYVSFCRVGTGLNEGEYDEVFHKLNKAGLTRGPPPK